MRTSNQKIKDSVKQKYSEIAGQNKAQNAASACGCGAPSEEIYNIMNEEYSGIGGYVEDADLGLGCGLPTQFAHIREGDTVIDLGSGAGNDCFVARHETGPTGKVLGIDFSETMIAKARSNAEKLGFNNVEFRSGDIEAMPVSDHIADVVVSNCVLNLVPDKSAVFAEIFRVLKPGGHFSISDIVLSGHLPEALQKSAEMYVGCVAGAIQKEDYLNHIQNTGFENLVLQKERAIDLPNDLLAQYLSPEEITAFKSGDTGIYSISVYAEKPGGDVTNLQPASTTKTDCTPGSGCC
ncbi:arsenite methyltransferase [Sinomicrobium weinanense]|uniref:Arsenite methyltransferase n=1 Tax=Sinomicrobium weinanense TaxID=2842200 RepID=A0A926JPY4_9FLAO|nr:arsenite methyltransferase [Sinomicrobium weinanense]MBC9795298.1 arsenite methyltransferase [Sinomicrobium weinanense]MBU3125770.1 arsenite methyltransferase [Sinomicrobium weinanense]